MIGKVHLSLLVVVVLCMVMGCVNSESVVPPEPNRFGDSFLGKLPQSVLRGLRDSSQAVIQVNVTRYSESRGITRVKSGGVAITSNLALVPAHALRDAELVYATSGGFDRDFAWEESRSFPVRVIVADTECDVALIQPVAADEGLEPFQFGQPIELGFNRPIQESEELFYIGSSGVIKRGRVNNDADRGFRPYPRLTTIQLQLTSRDCCGPVVRSDGTLVGLILRRGIGTARGNLSWFIAVDEALNCLAHNYIR